MSVAALDVDMDAKMQQRILYSSVCLHSQTRGAIIDLRTSIDVLVCVDRKDISQLRNGILSRICETSGAPHASTRRAF